MCAMSFLNTNVVVSHSLNKWMKRILLKIFKLYVQLKGWVFLFQLSFFMCLRMCGNLRVWIWPLMQRPVGPSQVENSAILSETEICLPGTVESINPSKKWMFFFFAGIDSFRDICEKLPLNGSLAHSLGKLFVCWSANKRIAVQSFKTAG